MEWPVPDDRWCSQTAVRPSVACNMTKFNSFRRSLGPSRNRVMGFMLPWDGWDAESRRKVSTNSLGAAIVPGYARIFPVVACKSSLKCDLHGHVRNWLRRHQNKHDVNHWWFGGGSSLSSATEVSFCFSPSSIIQEDEENRFLSDEKKKKKVRGSSKMFRVSDRAKKKKKNHHFAEFDGTPGIKSFERK